VVFAQGSGLIIAGGLTQRATTTDAIAMLDPATGKLTLAGRLATPTHDAAGAILAGRPYVFGGGVQASTAGVQALQPRRAATVTGRLPGPRSDSAALTLGGTAYLLGGYDGLSYDANVLATTDGNHFRTVATLPVPVRYPAVAGAGSQIWVFGGQTAAGPSNVIQQVDLATGRTTVVGHLPTPTTGAVAFSLGGRIFVAGGKVQMPAGPASHGRSSAAPGSPLTTSNAVLGFDPRHHAVTLAGALPVPVANAAVAVLAGTAFLVGGNNGQRQVPTVTRLRLVPSASALPPASALPAASLGAASLTATQASGGQAPVRAGQAPARATGVASRPGSPSSGVSGTTGITVAKVRQPAVPAPGPAQPAVAPTPGPAQPAVTAGAGPRAQLAAALAAGTSSSFLTSAPWLRPAHGAGHLAPHSDPSVLPGDILIADNWNNRLLVLDPQGRIRWRFPRPGDLAHGQTFLLPDDAFFSPSGRYIIATEEEDSVISVIDIARHKIVYRYGTPGVPGNWQNHLANPDDAMMMPGGTIIAADIENCRLLLMRPPLHQPKRVIGQTSACGHNPPHMFASPNGAFPATNGRYLVTEINGDWASQIGLHGHVYWSTHPPGVSYPSDTNEVYPGRFLTADYSASGQVVEFTSSGRLLWRFGGLNHPSLALPLPNGDILVNDDYNDRVIVIDPVTNRIVWQYGHTGVTGTAPGYLNDPDGIDLAPPDSMLITHAATMGRP
jgi:outer membrane protein assembly factor BamB